MNHVTPVEREAQATALAPSSPLTGQTDSVQLIRWIDIRQLIAGYRRAYAIDIERYFATVPALGLFYDNETGLSFYDPPIVGEPEFYAELSKLPWYHPSDRPDFEIGARYIPNGSHVLEIGAGVGHFYRYLQNADYLGLEYNPDAVMTANMAGVPVINADVHDLAAARPEAFDVVCSFQVLEHVRKPREFIEAAVALTKPGGIVILATPNAGSYISRCRDLLNAPPHHITWWEDRAWRWVADTFGLDVLDVVHTPINRMVVHWARMIAANGLAAQLGVTLNPVIDESPLRHRIDEMAIPIVNAIVSGIAHPGDIPEVGHTSVAVFFKNPITTNQRSVI